MVHDAVDGGRGGERVLEDAVPLREDQVRGDDHAAPLVALGQEGEQHLHLLAALLHVADVVEHHDAEAIEAAQLPLQLQVALGAQEPRDEREGRGEQHAPAPLDQLVGDGDRDVCFSPAR